MYRNSIRIPTESQSVVMTDRSTWRHNRWRRRIYSKTREAMWRAADAVEPNAVPKADCEVVFSEHRCLYGTVEGVDGLELGCRDITLSKDQSCLAVCGRDKHAFFLTKKYDKQYGYGERPRQYPKEEAEKYCRA